MRWELLASERTLLAAILAKIEAAAALCKIIALTLQYEGLPRRRRPFTFRGLAANRRTDRPNFSDHPRVWAGELS